MHGIHFIVDYVDSFQIFLTTTKKSRIFRAREMNKQQQPLTMKKQKSLMDPHCVSPNHHMFEKGIFGTVFFFGSVDLSVWLVEWNGSDLTSLY